ncbi:MAG: diadenylate cyclase CdaA [Chthoniobacteraceae bacterium]
MNFISDHWKDGLEILILWTGLYWLWVFFRGTRGAKVLTGLAVLFLVMSVLSEFFGLKVIGELLRYLSTFLVLAVVVIFQPELRRALAALGSNRLFALATSTRETTELITEIAFDLSNQQLGALIAIERDTNIESFADSGVAIDCKLSRELAVTLFFPKTPLHDGGIIIRDDRIVSAACVFPVSQRVDLDRTLGTRHRAALGLSEESDAVVIVVSEETGIVSICHRGRIERNFDPESFQRRLGELLLLEKDAKNTRTDPKSLAGKAPVAPAGGDAVDGHPQQTQRDKLAF